MATPRPPMLAALKKAFAAAHACTERTARRAANANTREWQEFVAKYGMDAAQKLSTAQPMTEAEAGAIQVMSPASPATTPPPEEADLPDSALSEPERIVKVQWRVYKQAAEAWAAALKSGDTIAAGGFGQATIKAQEAYYKAQARLEQWEVSNRRLVPIAEFHALLPALGSLFQLIRGFPAEIALAANTQAPATARAAGEEWLQARFMPQARAVLAKLNGDEPAPDLAAAA